MLKFQCQDDSLKIFPNGNFKSCGPEIFALKLLFNIFIKIIFGINMSIVLMI